MRLIEKVEIRYLRSLYSADVSDAGDLNILFGRNDSGKSNFLRALNLFFNGETDLEREPDFGIDLSDTRRTQAKKGASRQFFSIRLHFRVPANYRRSLGNKMWVKKQWNRDGGVTDTYPRHLTKGSRIQLTKFLGSIDFTYIPAIKDNEIFSGLVQRMYDAAAESQNLKSSTVSFINSIRSATRDLSESLEQTLGTTTRLAAPNDMGELFRSLDFTSGDDDHSLLLQKGDGIKVRHIPELLRYINEKESLVRNFIWGFEEPENSLDLGAAVSEALRFAGFAQRSDTQIFITSHSPAFYLAGADDTKIAVRRFFVNKQQEIDGKIAPLNAIRGIDTVDLAEQAMGEASLHELPYVIRKLTDLQRENRDVIEKISLLESQFEEISRPCIFVEGESEAKCLAPILKLQQPNAVVRKLKGTPSTTSELIKRVFEDGGQLAAVKTVFLFDYDNAGRSAFSNISGNSEHHAPYQLNDCIVVACLPTTPNYDKFLGTYGIPRDKCFFPLEFCFDAEVAAEVLYSIMSEDQREQACLRIRDEYHKHLPQEKSHILRLLDPGTPDWFWSRGVPNALKSEFFKSCDAAAAPSSLSDIVVSLTNYL